MVRHILTKYKSLGLHKKTMIIYVLFILIPASALALCSISLISKRIKSSYYSAQQMNLGTLQNALEIEQHEIENTARYFENSEGTMHILNGEYPLLSDLMYQYESVLVPLFSTVKVNENIKKVALFGYRDFPLEMDNGLGKIDILPNESEIKHRLGQHLSYWEFSWEEQKPILRYYRKLTKTTFPYNIGVLVYQVDMDRICQRLYSQTSIPFYLSLTNGNYLLFDGSNYFPIDSIPDPSTDNQQFEMLFDNGFPSFIMPIPPIRNVLTGMNSLFICLLLLVLALMLYYRAITSMIIHRLQYFTQHLNSSESDHLSPYVESDDYRNSTDEITMTIHAYNHLVEQVNHLIDDNLRSKIAKQASDYYALQAQIQPHFLYNILENIRMSAENNHDLLTADMLHNLGMQMRYNLNMSNSPLRLTEELCFAKNYLNIQKIRMQSRITYKISVSAEIDDYYCPRFTIQPLLENALQHGYHPGSVLTIEILVEDAAPDIKVRIIDDGNGISESNLEKLSNQIKLGNTEDSDHVGLLNVNKRLMSFCNSQKPVLHINSHENNGTEVYFLLPLLHDDNTAASERTHYEYSHC